MTAERLRQIRTRIDAMSLRERLFVFGAAVVAALALVQLLLIDTGQARVGAAEARLQAADTALAQIARQQAGLAGRAGDDPDKAARAALAAHEARLAELDAELERRGRALVPPQRMPQVLKDVVRGGDGVRVAGFRTLDPQPVQLADAVDGAPPGFYRHGFEITLTGRYAELVAYLERLEVLPWRLSWVEARLDATARPELALILTVHTLSLEEAWLRV